MADKEFGGKLRTLRNKKGLTQQQVATILGLKNKSTLGSWEVGKSEPDSATLIKLCRIYGLEDFSYFEDAEPSKINESNMDISEKELDKVTADLENALVRLGVIKEGEDLTDEQFESISNFISTNAPMLRKLIKKD